MRTRRGFGRGLGLLGALLPLVDLVPQLVALTGGGVDASARLGQTLFSAGATLAFPREILAAELLAASGDGHLALRLLHRAR